MFGDQPRSVVRIYQDYNFVLCFDNSCLPRREALFTRVVWEPHRGSQPLVFSAARQSLDASSSLSLDDGIDYSRLSVGEDVLPKSEVFLLSITAFRNFAFTLEFNSQHLRFVRYHTHLWVV